MASALERSREVGRVLGMARRPFDPSEATLEEGLLQARGRARPRGRGKARARAQTWSCTSRSSSWAAPKESSAVNLEGSRNVFESAVSAGVKRLVYASSVAAYGFHRENPSAHRGGGGAGQLPASTTRAQKAEVEEVLGETLAGSCDGGVCVSAVRRRRADAPLLIDSVRLREMSGSDCPKR